MTKAMTRRPLFIGRVTLESTRQRRCFKCQRFVGRRNKSYEYGARARNLDACGKCHRRMHRRAWAAVGDVRA